LEGILEIYKAIAFGPFFYQRLIFYFFHLPLFYITIFLTIVIFTSLVCKTKIKQTTKIFSTFFCIILLVPIIDVITSQGVGYHLHYPDNIFNIFINAFSPKDVPDSTWGQRVVFLLSGIGVAGYGYIKTKSLHKSILLFVLTYITIVLLGGFPSLLVNVITGAPVGTYLRQGGFLLTDTQKYTMTFLLLLLPISIFYSLRHDFRNTVIFLRSIRWERNVFYGAMCGLGFYIGYFLFGSEYPNAFRNFFDYFAILGLFLIGFLSFQGEAIINDFYDKEGDTITRKRNPLIGKEAIAPRFYLTWGLLLIFFSLLFGLCLNFSAFILVSLIHISAFIYSSPRIRIKKIPLFSTFIIAFASLLCVATGLTIFCDEGVFLAFPQRLIYSLLLSVTLGFIAKDIQDIEADRLQGVFTIPVLLGKNVSAVFVGFSFFVFPIFFGSIKLFIVGAVFSVIVVLYIVLQKRPKELFYFLLLFLYGFLLILYFAEHPEKLDSGVGQRGVSATRIYRQAKKHYEQGELDEAEKLFRQVIAMVPFYEGGYYHTIRILIEKGDYEGAREIIDKTKMLGLTRKRFLYMEGLNNLFTGREAEAFNLIKKAISMGQKDDCIWYYWGRLLLKKGLIADALFYLRAYCVQCPFDKDGLYWLNRAKKANSNLDNF